MPELEAMRWYSVHFVAAAICEKFAVTADLEVRPRLADRTDVLEFHPRSNLGTCRIIDLATFWGSMAEELMVRDAEYRLK